MEWRLSLFCVLLNRFALIILRAYMYMIKAITHLRVNIDKKTKLYAINSPPDQEVLVVNSVYHSELLVDLCEKNVTTFLFKLRYVYKKKL